MDGCCNFEELINNYKKTGNISNLIQAANTCISQNKYKDALKILLSAYNNTPNSKLARKIGEIYFYSGKYKKALKYYKSVMDLEDISTYNLYDLACCYHYLKDYKEAYKNYLNALSLDRYNIKAINNLGCLYYETKNYQDAFDSFSLSISYTKNNPEAYYYLGILYREFLNDIELSVLHLKRAVWLDPEHLETYLELIKTYKKSNNTDGIKDIEQTISEKFPNCNYEKIA